MILKKRLTAACAALLPAVFLCSAFADVGIVRRHEVAAPSGYVLSVSSAQSRLWIEGDSTFHRYDAQASEIILTASGSSRGDSGAAVSADASKGIIESPGLANFVLKVPVAGLKSGIPGLAGKIHGTLKHKKFPEIVFTISDYKSVPAPQSKDAASPSAEKNAYNITASGTLAIAGVSREETLEFEAFPDGDFIRIKGRKDILMSDYGVKPPAVLFVKAADKVEVRWDIILEVSRR